MSGWKPKAHADAEPGLPSIVRGANGGVGQGTGAWARNGAWAKNGGVSRNWGGQTAGRAGIEIDDSQFGGIGVWEPGTVNFPPPLVFVWNFAGK
jgi:hypothetical protein